MFDWVLNVSLHTPVHFRYFVFFMVLWKEFDSFQNKNQSTYIQKYRAKGILTYNIEEIVGRAGSGIIYF